MHPDFRHSVTFVSDNSRTNNQFVPYRVGVEKLLVAGTNELSIAFESAWFKGKEHEKKNGKLALWNGDSSRLHVRKAQYK
jgi:beta-mannosidase